MLKQDIVVGGHYTAKVNDKIVTVRVDEIKELPGYGSRGGIGKTKGMTIYYVTNLTTGRKTQFKSAAKFRAGVAPSVPSTPSMFPEENKSTATEVPPAPVEESTPTPSVSPPKRVAVGRTAKTTKLPKSAQAVREHLEEKYAMPGESAEEMRKRAAEAFQDSEEKSKGVTNFFEQGDKAQAMVEEMCGPGAIDGAVVDVSLEALKAAVSVPAMVNPISPPGPPASTSPSGKMLGGLAAKIKPISTPPHLVVIARAGTGKTFTLVVGVVYLFRDLIPGLWDTLIERLGFDPVPSPQQQAVWDSMKLSVGTVRTIQFTAFNKAIVSDFESKWKWVIESLANLGVQFAFNTLHSVGIRSVMKSLGRMAVEENNVKTIIANLLSMDIRDVRKYKGCVLEATDKLVAMCKLNLVGLTNDTEVNGYETGLTNESLDKLTRHYGIELVDDDGVDRTEEVYKLVPSVLDQCRDPLRAGAIDYNDMIWLPVVMGLPVTKNDMLLVDEFQDTSPCSQALAEKAGRRLICCGDDRQAIYGFAGAGVDSIEKAQKNLGNTTVGCITLPLTVTRRCGKLIVKEAQKIVPDFEAHESNALGIIGHAKYPMQKVGDSWVELPWEATYAAKATSGNLVVCRVNAPLVSQCFRFLKRGIKATIQGKDIARGIISTVERLVPEGHRASPGSVITLIGKLDDWLSSEVSKESSRRIPDEGKIIALHDRHDCIVCFTEGATSVNEVIQKIESIFTDNKNYPGIRLSSIHKAKGLEADRVFFLEPQGATVPHPMAKSGWQIKQEWNLRYVAITRTIKELVYVS